eukprot:11208976-Lingulodinium_polyedra.AAC.1
MLDARADAIMLRRNIGSDCVSTRRNRRVTASTSSLRAPPNCVCAHICWAWAWAQTAHGHWCRRRADT